VKGLQYGRATRLERALSRKHKIQSASKAQGRIQRGQSLEMYVGDVPSQPQHWPQQRKHFMSHTIEVWASRMSIKRMVSGARLAHFGFWDHILMRQTLWGASISTRVQACTMNGPRQVMGFRIPHVCEWVVAEDAQVDRAAQNQLKFCITIFFRLSATCASISRKTIILRVKRGVPMCRCTVSFPAIR